MARHPSTTKLLFAILTALAVMLGGVRTASVVLAHRTIHHGDPAWQRGAAEREHVAEAAQGGAIVVKGRHDSRGGGDGIAGTPWAARAGIVSSSIDTPAIAGSPSLAPASWSPPGRARARLMVFHL